MGRTPAIAIIKQHAAKAKFEKKLSVFESILGSSQLESLPKTMRPTTFADWEDTELGVFKFSRNLLYPKSGEGVPKKDEYSILRTQMETLLEKLKNLRLKKSKKENKEDDLLERVEVAERRAQTYVNNYQLVLVELQERDQQILQLKLQVRRAREKDGKVTILKTVVSKKSTDK
jgi:hypothetical protein